jgi:hypothetical protein
MKKRLSGIISNIKDILDGDEEPDVPHDSVTGRPVSTGKQEIYAENSAKQKERNSLG